MTVKGELPVPILEFPHWRINFRPTQYESELIPSLAECFALIEQTTVRLRGWPYPYLSPRPNERSQGNNWVASWSEFGGHMEYWRLYQSGQFLHLFTVREVLERGWRQKLESDAQSHTGWPTDLDSAQVPGFFSLENFLYTVTEIFEFAARLCQRGVYKGMLQINIQISNIKGFVLTPGCERGWSEYRAAGEDTLSNSWTISGSELLSNSPQHSLEAMKWFFERFGWLSPSMEVLRADQKKYLQGRL